MTKTARERLEGVERYLFDHLTEAERNRFEEHLFSCPVCADEARITAIFAANACAVFLQGFGPPSVRPGWSESVCLRPVPAG
jgi:putative zinc finger protein